MPSQRRDSGFSMIELLVTMTLLGVMMAIAVAGYGAWARASGQKGAARELEAVLGHAQQRAVTEGRAVCVDFRVAQNDYAVYRGACDVASRVRVLGPVRFGQAAVHVAAPSFAGPAGTSTGVTFSARGTASPGSVQITRTGSSRVYTVVVERLTGRVRLT